MIDLVAAVIGGLVAGMFVAMPIWIFPLMEWINPGGKLD